MGHAALKRCMYRVGGLGALKSWHFLKEHNPVWAAKVCGERVRRASQAIPRPNLQRVHSVRAVRNAFRNRPHMPRPRYRLEERPELGRAHMAYIDVAAFYIIAVRPLCHLELSLTGICSFHTDILERMSLQRQCKSS